ncbi:MAG: fibronectin type III domain-containing protein, partial [Gemmatimonadetes bacterium]|nr:fibronectin type III domain-containing protein [Gemmatimonadota bacterium]
MRTGILRVLTIALVFSVLVSPISAPQATAQGTDPGPITIPDQPLTPDPTPTPEPAPTPEPTPTPDQAPSFSTAISGLSFTEDEEATAVTLPAANGGDGALSYGLTGLPGGMTFDAASRALGGTPTEAGEFALTYTATDEDGDEASFSLTVTVDPAPQAVRSKTGPDAPGSLKAVRAPSATTMTPALDVTWTTPADNGFPITKYEIWYGVAKDNMTKVTAGATATSIRLTSLAAGTTYHVRVLAFAGNSGQHGVAGDRADTTGKTNNPPTEGQIYLLDNTDSWGSLYVNDVSGYFSDGDSDTLTFEASSTRPGIASVSIEDDGTEFERYFRNPGTATATYAVRDGYGGYASRSITLTVTANVTRNVPERSPAGTNVGIPVTGMQPPEPDNNQVYTYTLTGAAATYFEIDSSTGQITVTEGTTLDYETKDSYTGKVSWTVQGQTAVANLTIKVTDVEATVAAPTLTRTPFDEPSKPALDVTWTAAANGLTITGYEGQYREQVADGETANAWTAYSGTLGATATTFNVPDLKPGGRYEARVRAVTSEEGTGPWSDVASGQANNTPYTIGYIADSTIPWGHSSGYTFDGKIFRDTDGDELTFFVSAKNPGIMRASIVEGTPHDSLLTVASNPGSTEVTYGVRDPYGGSVELTMTATGVANPVRSVDENSAAGTAAGRPVVGNPYGEETYTHTLTGDATDAFVIDATTGQISVKEGASLDYETKSSYTGKVEWTVNGQDVEADLTINLNDIEADKTATPTITRTEFSAPSKPALDVTWTATDANGLTVRDYRAQYRKKAADGEEPEAWTEYPKKLSATATSLTLSDLEAGATYEVRVRVRTIEESGGPWSDIAERQANTPPHTTGFIVDATIPWGHSYGYTFDGHIFGDTDGDELTFFVTAKNPGIMQASIVEGTPHDSLLMIASNPASTKVTYGVRDPYGGSVELTMTATGVANPVRSVDENSAAGTAVGRAVVGNPYGEETYTHTLTGDATDAFVIDATTGQI